MRGYRFFLALLFLSLITLNAAKNQDNSTEEPAVELSNEVQIENAQGELSKIQKELSRGNSVWLKSYNSYMAYQESRKSLARGISIALTS